MSISDCLFNSQINNNFPELFRQGYTHRNQLLILVESSQIRLYLQFSNSGILILEKIDLRLLSN